jgi:Flp pilus assembly protein TadD
LHTGLGIAPSDGGLHHALGLGLIPLKPLDEALVELRLAADLAGNSAQYAYLYGVALHSAGRPQDALAHLKESQNAHPGDREILIAITSFSREAGVGNSIATRRKIIQDCPDDPTVRRLLDELRCQAPPR